MDKKLAIQRIKETFENSFNKDSFVDFIIELLNRIDGSKAFHARGYVKEKYKKSAGIIKTYERIGTYTDSDDNKIDVLIVYLSKDNSIERARTTLRNFVADYLKGRGEKDAALVAFVSPNQKDWRFSLVKMDYQLKKDKVKQEFTPARRFSFLVGENESSHTAQTQLVPILEDDINNPTLERLEEAFNIETVTKEFFKKYHGLFLHFQKSLDNIVKNDKKIKQDFKDKKIDTADFAKKTLGQIVFLYFLQKKGWFGVKRGEKWGSGSKHFLRELFDKKHGDYKNFFNNVLEPLFYEALRLERPKDYYDKFECRIPFLNGGLFDPLNDYDWQDTDIIILNEIFSNDNPTKEGDKGDGILDIFDRYNFTVKEDEPFEKEVAIDPEMLGKVFENLLEVKDRKSKGTYYTPREIVHYMCQQSLINYLHTELNPTKKTLFKEDAEQSKLFGKPDPKQLKLSSPKNKEIISKDDIEKLIKYGETVVEHDNRVIKKGKETSKYSFKFSKDIRDNAKLIDEKLKNIRICDPAIGSGAFPVGMMNEIIRARNVLTNYIKDKESRAIYDFKRHAIQNCLYGVDIDSSAIEIAKLRLWLSLIVDEDNIKQIKPLPNLDYKIVCGNSLLGVERNLFNIGLFSELEELKPLYFDETNVSKKQEYKNKIDKLIDQITNGHKDFDFEIYFSEVFHEKGGFDVAIGNPPYVQLQKFSGQDIQKRYEKDGYQTFKKTGDIYALFYERGLEITKKNTGLLCYITSNKWMRAGYGESLRKYFSEKNPLQLLDFGGFKVFKNVAVDTNILLVQNTDNKNQLKAVHFKNDYKKGVEIIEYFNDNAVELKNISSDTWFVGSQAEIDLKKKIKEKGIPLKDWDVKINYGIKTGFNKAFIIDDKTKNELIKKDPKSKEIIKPVLGGKNLERYSYQWTGLYLINSHNGFKNSDADVLPVDIKIYPAIKEHLDKYWKNIKKRQDQGSTSYNLRDCAYLEEFEKEKVAWLNLNRKWKFSYVEPNIFIEASLNFISTDKYPKFLTAILSSKLHLFYFKMTGRMHDNGGYMCKIDTISNFPIPKISSEQQKPFIEIVDKILAITKSDDYLKNSSKQVKVKKLEAKIDQLVYKLYNLTKKEIEIVEGN